MTTREIYLDYNATQPICAAARACLERLLRDDLLGNPSSTHGPGQKARALVEEAREIILAASGLRDHQLVFTSGGTESNQIAARRLIQDPTRSHSTWVLTGELEHPSLRNALRALLPADRIHDLAITTEGFYDPEDPRLPAFLDRAGPGLTVFLQAANNELGTIHELETLRDRLDPGALWHSDATQYWLRESADLGHLRADAITVSGHKLGALAGIGGLFLHRDRVPHLEPPSSQEGGWRAGTENLFGILSFAAAVQERLQNLENERAHVRTLRDELANRLRRSPIGFALNNPADPRLPNTLNIRFPRGDGRSILLALQLAGLALSPGSACASGASLPSPVLRAMGLTEDEARRSVRVSLGPANTLSQVEEVVRLFESIATRFAGSSTQDSRG